MTKKIILILIFQICSVSYADVGIRWLGFSAWLLDIGIGNHFILSPLYASGNVSSTIFTTVTTYKGSEYGGRLTFSFSPVFTDSWYLFGQYNKGSYTVTETSSSGTATGKVNATLQAAGLGYAWYWKTVYINFGMGATNYSFPKTTLTRSDGSTTNMLTPLTLPAAFDLGIGLRF